MRVLVTGGAGFIGSHVTEVLLSSGHEVAVLDDLSTGNRQRLPAGADLFVADIRSSQAAGWVEVLAPDVLCHQAAQVSVPHSVREPARDADLNIVGLLNMVEAARAGGRLRRVVFASSGGALYGEVRRAAAETAPLRPVSPYGISKRAAETYLDYYARHCRLPTLALRYANVYGPRQDAAGEAGVVAIFTSQMLRQKQPVIYGDGEQVRDFVYVRDVARANRLAVESDLTGALNIGTGWETTINRLYGLLSQATGWDEAPVYEAPREGDLRRSLLSPEAAAKKLGWRPQIELEEGLRQTVAWFRNEG